MPTAAAIHTVRRLRSGAPVTRGTKLIATWVFDNSPNNPHNPDPSVEVRYGEQTWEEMLNGFMEVAMDPVADPRDAARHH